jgi:hypothetical protein
MPKKKASRRRTISIPSPSLQAVTLEIEGLPPGLLLHPFDEEKLGEVVDSMDPETAKLKTRGKKDPVAEYEHYLGIWQVAPRSRVGRSTQKDATFYLDARAPLRAFARGAKSVNKVAIKDVPGAITIEPDGTVGPHPVVFVVGRPTRHTCRAVVNRGAVDIRTRVLLPQWSMKIRFHVNTAMLSLEQALLCVQNAGLGVGLGDWRPERAGVHGKFRIVKAYD